MKASELRAGEYGIALDGILVIKGDAGYTVAYNHEVKRCSELPIDVEIKEVKTITKQEFIVQFDGAVVLTSADKLKTFIATAVINNKDTRHVTITHI